MTDGLYTYETVPTEEPPLMDKKTADGSIDAQYTFFDVPGNTQLPVSGAVEATDNMVQGIRIANGAGSLVFATQDTHILGQNPTIVSSFEGIERETFVTPDMVDSWMERDNPIRPSANFTFAQYRRWVHLVHGAMIWGDHGIFRDPLHAIVAEILDELRKNPNFQIFSKGTHPSAIIGNGFCPESYSADEMSTGESLGLYEFLVARGITRVKIRGVAGDFCPGTTALNLARKGLDIWVCVDAQASVKVPNYAGTGMTSEQFMIQKLLDAGVHFYTTADDLRVNARFLTA